MRAPSPMMAESKSNGSAAVESQGVPNAISAHGYQEGLDYNEGEELVILHHNLYHMTLEAKLRVFVMLFTIIVVPATIVFIVCYVRDRRKQRRHKKQVAAQQQDSPDPALPYSARLSRPVPGSVSEYPSVPGKPQASDEVKVRKVSFANNVPDTDGRRSTVSSICRRQFFSDPLMEMEDDVFSEDEVNAQNKAQDTTTEKRSFIRKTGNHGRNINDGCSANTNSLEDERELFFPGNIPVSESGTAT